MLLGKRIAALRREKNLRQEDLSRLLGVSRQTISNYEKGVRDPAPQMLSKMAKFFNVSTDYLLDLTDDRSHRHRVQEETQPYLEQVYSSDPAENGLWFLFRKLAPEDRSCVEFLIRRLTGLK